jgi:heme oxygenase (mycobilin-producing)
MTAHTIWESTFPVDRRQEGAEVTRAIWQDMRGFDGYVGHEIVEDLDHPGHLIVVGRWESREAADAALSYRASPNARRVDALVSAPRRRTVGEAIDTGAGITP